VNRITCEAAIAAIDAWIDGELTAEQAEVLCRHLDICPPCKSHSEIESLVKDKIAQCCTVETPPALRERIMVQMTQISFRNGEHTEISIRFEQD
jgi:anti-sigma factor (TIGR02949 family)